MYRLDNNATRQGHRFLNPSFSTTLLDQIYRSVDEGERNDSGDMKFYRETMGKKHTRTTNGKCNRALQEEQDPATASFRRARLLEKWMDNKVSEKVGTWSQGRKHTTEMDRKLHHCLRDREQDVLFFSSTSSSSDSSSGGFSSSDTESMYGVRSHSRASCFAPARTKPVRTSVERSEKKAFSERIHSGALFNEQKGSMRIFDGCCHGSNSNTQCIATHDETLIKSKSRALKIYNNLKKVKQPISPGGKLTNFLNSLFTTGNAKKTKSTSSVGACEDVINFGRKAKSGQASSTCSSASSFSRSCLSKTSPSSRGKLCSGLKRTVRFYPVSVIVDEDSRPCGHKCLYEEQDTSLMAVSVPTAWKIGRSPPTKKIDDEELKFTAMEKSKRVEEAARKFLEEYRHNNQKKKSDLILRDFAEEEEEDDDDDDAASYSSSDLFELDHLAVMGNGRYCEELPVYETTHVSTNRAIADSLVM